MRRITILLAAAAAAAVVATSVPSSGAREDAPAAAHRHAATSSGDSSPELAAAIARARIALAPFATNLEGARAAGYKMTITPMMPDMGYHYMNPDVKGFALRSSCTCAGERRRSSWPPSGCSPAGRPSRRCRAPGTALSVPPATTSTGPSRPRRTRRRARRRARTAERRSASGNPDLVTLHLWLWYPNPAGVFNSTNPLVSPFDSPRA
jgi:hypothetical protein